MKRILILTAGFGEGHNTAARGLLNAFQDYFPEKAFAETADLFEPYGETYRRMRQRYLHTVNHSPKLWANCYRIMDSLPVAEWGTRWCMPKLRDSFAQTVERFQPDAVLSCYPAYVVLRAAAKAQHIPFYSVVTDTQTVNRVWFREPSDAYFVPDETTRSILAKRGVPEDTLHAFGFPVSPIFDETPDERSPIDGNHPARVLYVVNKGNPDAPQWMDMLSKRGDISLTVAVGLDTELRDHALRLADYAHNPMRILGWVDDMPRQLKQHHMVIAKAGGAMTHECIAANTPMLISQVFPGQEAGNARKVESAFAGHVTSTPEALARQLTRWLRDNGEGWNRAHAAMQRLHTPHAARRIAAQTLAWAKNGTAKPPQALAV